MKSSSPTSIGKAVVAFAFLGGLVLVFGWGFVSLLRLLPAGLTTAVVTGGLAVFASTLTVVLAKHHDRRKELDSLYRDKKIEIYDDFLRRMFILFTGDEDGKREDQDFVAFLREHHRKLILWSGPKALHEFSRWMTQCKTDSSSAKTLLQMEDFFLALRQDLGHDNKGIERGDLIALMLRNHQLFLSEVAKNPNVSMNDIATLEKKLAADEKHT